VVNDVLLAHLPLHLFRLAFLWVHDDGFVPRPRIVHRLLARLSTQLRQGSRTVEYVFPLLLNMSFVVTPRGTADFVTVYLEQKFGRDDFEPDLFSTEVIEKEWKQNADRASIYKASLPELLREEP
jgi:hypothetical protein